MKTKSFNPLEKAVNFCRRLRVVSNTDSLMPPVSTVKRPLSLTGFTLIEILVASYIFMVVVVTAVAAFAMIKRSNETSDDFRQTNQCAREGENFISSLFRSASYGNPRVYGLVDNGGSYVLRAIKEPTQNTPELELNFSGFVVFSQVPVDNKLAFKAIYKQIAHNVTFNRDEGVYYFKSGVVDVASALYPGFDPSNNIPASISFSSALSSAQPIFSTEACSALIESDAKFNLTPMTPFKLTKGRDVKNQDVFILSLNDYIFTNFETTQIDAKSFSRMFLSSTNEATKL